MLKQFTPALATIGAAVITIVTAATAHAVVVNPQYLVDDGSAESTVGFTPVNTAGSCVASPGELIGDLLWLNEFNVEPDGDWIDSVSISWGVPQKSPCPNPQSVLGVDKDANGNPQIAKLSLYQHNDQTGVLDLLTQAETEVKLAGPSAFVKVKFDQTKQVKGRFFVGALFPNQLQGHFPATLDTNGLNYNRSWIGFINRFSPTARLAQPNFEGSIPLKDIAKYSPGNWLLRANSTKNPNAPITSVPESNLAIGLLAIGALGTGVLLKRKLHRK